MLDSRHRVSDWAQLVRSEFVQMPGLCLTKPQAQRLWGLDPITCEAVLETLVDAEFLRRTRDGFYLRAGSETVLRRVPQRAVSGGLKAMNGSFARSAIGPPACSDEELVLAYQQGELEAFEELYDRYAKPLYNFLRRAAPHSGDADELLLRTFLKVHAALHSYQPTGTVRTWMFAVARTVVHDDVRRHTPGPATFEDRDERFGPAAAQDDHGREIERLLTEAAAAFFCRERQARR